MDRLYKIYNLLDRKNKKYLFFLLLPTSIMQSALTMLSIAIIMPFIAVVIQPESIQSNGVLLWLFNFFNFSDNKSFMLALGGVVLFFLIATNLFSLASIYVINNFIKNIKIMFSDKLFSIYANSPYEFYNNVNTSLLIKNISYEANVVADQILASIVYIISHLISIIFIMTLLVIIDPIITVSLVFVIGSVYAFIFILLRKKLSNGGWLMAESNRRRVKDLLECFGGIKIIKLLGKEKSFINRFSKNNRQFMQNQFKLNIIHESPRYVLETIAFGGVISILLYLLATMHQPSQIMGTLALYVFAGYRLMPSFQMIYSSFSHIQGHIKVLDNIYNELSNENRTIVKSKKTNSIVLKNKIIIDNIKYHYANSNFPFKQPINLTIKSKSAIGLVGKTGSGKTTLVDIILGLLKPNSGRLIIDNTAITCENMRQWQKQLGYVPQQIFLTDDSVKNNIAFGIDKEKIDLTKVEKAARMANLHEFIINDLPQAYDTKVGERGVRLSGGQVQRIGIARALYHDPAILVFDEATSSLDGFTEHLILEAIDKIASKKTLIIIAHRLTTVKKCDMIYVLDKGEIIESGSYDELLETSQHFRKMAMSS